MSSSRLEELSQKAPTRERYWTIGHNSSKEAKTVPACTVLLTCSLCQSTDRREADTYDHVFRLCPHPAVHQQCRLAFDAILTSATLSRRTRRSAWCPQGNRTIHSPESHLLCVGRWNKDQLKALSCVPVPTHTSEAIEAVLIDFSRVLVSSIDALWEAWKQAKYLKTVAQSACHPAFSPRPVKDHKVFYGPRFGHVSGVYTTGKEAQLQTMIGIGTTSTSASRSGRKLRRSLPLRLCSVNPALPLRM